MRIKTAIELNRKKIDKEPGLDLVQELLKLRAEVIQSKINQLTSQGFTKEFQTLVAYFDTLKDKNEKLKVYQMGMEKIIKQLTAECKEIAHVVWFLWTGFQTEVTQQVRLVLNETEKQVDILKGDYKKVLRKLKTLETKNNFLAEQNLTQEKLLMFQFDEFNKVSMKLIFEEYHNRLKIEEDFNKFKQATQVFFPNIDQ